MEKNTPIYDVSLSDEERAKWLVSQMTIEEKFGCFTLGIRNERLGIMASTCGGEGAHGVQARAGQREAYEPTATTSFTQPIGMAATFDKELIFKAGDVTGKESRAFSNAISKGGNSRLGPTIDLCRDPRWGRNEEGYGEDPYLTGKMASEYIKGMQDEHNYDGTPLKEGERGNRVRTGVVLKHFYANNQEWRRCYDNFDISDKVKYDYELEPYRYCALLGHAEGVMTSYNEINHLPAMLNHEVQDILKDKWGIKYAMTDGGDFLQTVNFHKYFKTHAESLAEGVKAGVDAMLDNPFEVTKAAKEAFEKGLISKAEMDKSIMCTVTELIRQGFFDPVDPYADLDMADVGTDEAKKISLQMSTESNVLLKNVNNFLPLKKDDDIAIIGHVADNWYMDWYGGKPTYKVTLKAGVEKKVHHAVPYESALNLIRFKYKDKYLGASHPAFMPMAMTEPEAAELILVDKAEDAVVFEQTNWGEGSNFLYAPAYRKFLTVGTDGKVSLGSDNPFSWFIFESFTIGTADSKRKNNPRNANSCELDKYWLDEEGGIKIHCFGNRNLYIKDGKLTTDPLERKKEESNTKEGGNDVSAWAGSEKEADVITVEMVSNGIERAKELAKKAKKVILALGCNPVVNAKEEIDRSTINMIPIQEKLAEEVFKVNPNVVVVLITNYPYAINRMQENVPAIITNATGSQDLGNGLASALFGDANPAGRLPMTWYKSDEDLPPLEDYDLIKNHRTYRYFDKPVLYPFGYGLSYAKFDYSDLKCEKEGKELKVSVNVKNTGKLSGDEVTQLYIKRVSPSLTVHPLRRLIGFERVHDLNPGESRSVSFKVNPDDLEIYVEKEGKKLIEPGKYLIYAGGNCLDEQVKIEIEL
ncbi:MAG: glycoside hydrolase family 3 C-terminal domain-containing protein [Lachnospiraceae bacterium]|nr:glycoside hydrolase family 3 C-terminal domain-containing protein [Lachnospiraceae bacterium]